MGEIAIIITRTFVLYFIILVIFRLMGKREIGELSILDLVVFIMIAELAVVGIEDAKDPLFHTVLPMVILMIIQIGLAYISFKNKKIRNLLDGKPTVVINKGEIDEAAMKHQRYNLDDLLMQLREKDIKNVADVEFAILEPSGKLSVLQKDKNKKNKDKPETSHLPLIMDGVIQEENLYKIGKTNLWLRQQLRKLGYKEIKNITFCSFSKNGSFHIDLNDDQ
ncbi:DUF421 domain-containing protein [Bacillus timonensis]|nr:DUF421 domain-containing protein [Bacillus timonensis]